MGDRPWASSAGRDDSERVVFHVDVDCFYAACERLREPALRGEPVVIGMGYEPDESGGAVATASYEAREFGVESAQPIGTALKRLPRKIDAVSDPDLDVSEAGFYRPVDMDYYRSVSERVMAILSESADVIREVSIDEAYLDVTDSVGWQRAEGVAREIKARIEDEVGVTVSIGVAPNMSAAKVASDAEKPDGLVVVEPGSVREFLSPLDVEALHGIGPVTAEELRDRGIETIGDLSAANRSALIDQFGERGRDLHRRARGEDDRAVEPRGRPKSLSRESAFAPPTDDFTKISSRIDELASAVADRAREKGALYRTIGIKVVTPPFDVNTRERSLSGPVDEPELVSEVAADLLSEFDGRRVRKVGVRVSNLSFTEGEQASLEGWEDDGPDDSTDRSHADEGSIADSSHAGGTSQDDATDVSSASPTSRPPNGQASITDFE